MDTVTVEGFAQRREELERLLTSNPYFAQEVEDVVRKCIRELKNQLGNAAKGGMMTDPRQAYKAVRMTVYRQIIGGNVNILQRRSANSGSSFNMARVPRQGRGGNRRARSPRTEKVDGYMGADRGFILRFLNSGTDDRITRYGNRGRITARNWFSESAPGGMDNAAERIANIIDDIIEDKLT